MICHVLINGLDACLKRILSCDIVDDQFLDRSCVIFPGSQGHRFPGSHADKSRDVQVAKGSCDESHVGPCDMFPRSHDTEGGTSTAHDSPCLSVTMLIIFSASASTIQLCLTNANYLCLDNATCLNLADISRYLLASMQIHQHLPLSHFQPSHVLAHLGTCPLLPPSLENLFELSPT